jgi:CO dehydrogenase/acetyl-CoA synthase beta subunit
MGLFDAYVEQIRRFAALKREHGKTAEHLHAGPVSWPVEKDRNLVLSQDTAVELGNPGDVSSAFLIWVNEPAAVHHGLITIVGPDLSALTNRRVPFGRVIMVGGTDFDEENSYMRYREMELLRYEVRLKGCMMRGASRFGREWSRVSRRALAKGFSLNTLGGALIDILKGCDYVRSVEILFVTGGREDVLELQKIADPVLKRIGAMKKMAEDDLLDCDTCAYSDVCREVSELRQMRSALNKGVSASG